MTDPAPDAGSEISPRGTPLDLIRERRARLSYLASARALNEPTTCTTSRSRLPFVGGPLCGELLDVPRPAPTIYRVPEESESPHGPGHYELVRARAPREPIAESQYRWRGEFTAVELVVLEAMRTGPDGPDGYDLFAIAARASLTWDEVSRTIMDVHAKIPAEHDPDGVPIDRVLKWALRPRS